VEGAGAYSVYAYQPGFTRTAATGTIAPPPPGTKGPESFSFPPLQAQQLAGSISRLITEASDLYDRGYIVATTNGRISTALDISTTFTLGAGASVPYSLMNLASGSPTSPAVTDVYFLYMVVWNSRNPVETLKFEVAPGKVDLSQGSIAGVNLTVQ
jgi:hypothetical protein